MGATPSWFVAQTGRKGTLDGEFNEPWGIAVAPDGTIWVADTWNHRLQQFTPDLQFLRKFGEFGESGGIQALYRKHHIDIEAMLDAIAQLLVRR